jgi:hypothetical protein
VKLSGSSSASSKGGRGVGSCEGSDGGGGRAAGRCGLLGLVVLEFFPMRDLGPSTKEVKLYAGE